MSIDDRLTELSIELPSPMDTIIITEATPRIMPKLVKNERSACNFKLFMPSLIVSNGINIAASAVLVFLECNTLEL